MNSSRFFENTSCEYYPCHKGLEHMNCLFCYCPLYHMPNCPGNYSMTRQENGAVKNCEDCLYPHRKENYDKVIRLLENSRTEN